MKPVALCKRAINCHYCDAKKYCKLFCMSDIELNLLKDKEKRQAGNKRLYHVNLSYKYYSNFLCDIANDMTDSRLIYKEIKRQIEYVTKTIERIGELHLFCAKLIDLQDVDIKVKTGEGYCILSGIGIIECEFDIEKSIPTFRVIGEMLDWFVYFLNNNTFVELTRCDIDLI